MMLRSFLSRLGGLFARRRSDRDLDEEIRVHLEMAIKENVQRGMSLREARYAARRRFGGLEQIKLDYRDHRGFPILDGVSQDLRYAFRMLRKSPGFAAVAIVSLALGIGLNTGIFTAVNAIILRPLPVESPEELVQLSLLRTQGGATYSLTYPDFQYYRENNEVFSGMIVSGGVPAIWATGGDSDERIRGYMVSGNYFDSLGVRPHLGRTFSPEEDRTQGTHPVVVLGYHFWRNRLESTPDILGRQLLLNGTSFTVVGIAPERFYGLTTGLQPAFWVPMMMQPVIRPGDEHLTRGHSWLQVHGRLQPGASLKQAQANLETLFAQLKDSFPERMENRHGIEVQKASGLPTTDAGPVSVWNIAGMLMTVAGLILLVACVNVANLSLARGIARSKEIAVRQALGAGRWRTVRQFFVESLLLASLGGGLGILLGKWPAGLLNQIGPVVGEPIYFDLALDPIVLAYTLGLSVLTAVVFGLMPAIEATRPEVVRALKEGTQTVASRGARLQNSLVVAQVALSLVVLIAAGLFLRSLQNAQKIELGFQPEQVVRLSFDLNLHGYDDDRALTFGGQLLERVRALPGVRAASLAHDLPLDFSASAAHVYPDGVEPVPENRYRAEYALISDQYFEAMGIPLLQGRTIEKRDRKGSVSVVVVNETMARIYWPGENPLGKRLTEGSRLQQTYEVVGVVGDSKYRSLSEDPQPFFYRPLLQSSARNLSLVVRTTVPPETMVASVRGAQSEVDSRVAPTEAGTMASQLDQVFFLPRTGALVLGSFGLLALVLASVGVYGVVAYAVSRRTREVGIRMAIGAHSGDVIRMVIGQGLRLGFLGVAFGLALGVAATRLLSSMLVNTSATDTAVFTAVPALLLLMVLAACYIPSRRAAAVNPAATLRYD